MKQIVLLSPSGVGKTTCIRLLEATGQFRYGITCATRLPRTREVQGYDYDFLTPAEFRQASAAGEMAENTNYAGNGTVYGILARRIQEAQEAPCPTLWVLDTRGLAWMRKHFPGETVGILLWAPADTCRWRMTMRGDAETDIERRLQSYDTEVMLGIKHADCVIDTTHLSPEQVAAEVLKRLGD